MTNIAKIAFLAAAALVFAGCGPKYRPGDWAGNSPTGTPASETQFSSQSVPAEDETLTTVDENDVRQSDTPADEKVAAWINDNRIPESAKLAVVYFGFDKFNVEEGERGKLDAAIDAVKRGNVYIVGYSDYFGTEEYNLALSDRRAQAVKNYLRGLGADDSAQIRALGEAFAVQNGTKAEVAEDRKVIVVDGNAE